MRTYYDVLGVSPSATQDELKSAYRRRSRECHPDAGGSEADMKEANQAWDTLRDPLRRAAYDSELSGREQSGPSAERLSIYIVDSLSLDQAVAVFAELFATLGFRVVAASPEQR